MKVSFFVTSDPIFSGFRKTLDSRMREPTNDGIGIETKSADPVTKDEDRTMLQKGVLSMNSAKGLSNAMFFYNGKVFGLRGGDEHIEL